MFKKLNPREGLKWKSFLPVTELVEVRQKDRNGKPDPPAGGQAQKQFLIRYQHPNHQ